MNSANVDGVRLEYETHGSGEPVVLIHGSVLADTYVPMLAEPSLDGYELVRYRRRGFGGSTHPTRRMLNNNSVFLSDMNYASTASGLGVSTTMLPYAVSCRGTPS